ncbi:MAG: glutathione S-transferase family protein [Rhodospirillales bacterium]
MLKILGRNNSSNVQKVLWCCGELGLKFERADLGGPFGGNKEASYLALNPMGLIPTIDDDGFVLWESNAILRYLAAKHGAGGLWPADPKTRADADRWMDWQLSAVGPAITPVFMGLIRTPPEKRDHAAIEAGRKRTAELFGMLDAHLARRRFVAGDSLTVGDIPLGVMAYRWFNFPVERPEHKHARAWYERLTQRPAFKQHVMLPIT